MKKLYILASALILLVAGFILPTAGAQVYKWKDSSGAVHYSDTPPSSGHYQRENPNAARSSGVNMGGGLSTFNKKEQAGKKKRDAARKKQKRVAKINQENCKRARANLKQLQSYKGRHALIKSKDGSVRRMTEKGRQTRMQNARKHIKKYCRQ